MTKAQVWHQAVFARDHGFCAAEQHANGCRGIAEVAHHVAFRSQIPTYCYWIVENGIAISELCHLLAHRSHNANISNERKRIAVDSVNAAIPDNFPDLKVPYFMERRIA